MAEYFCTECSKKLIGFDFSLGKDLRVCPCGSFIILDCDIEGVPIYDEYRSVKSEICIECAGSGSKLIHTMYQVTCDSCNGTGKV